MAAPPPGARLDGSAHAGLHTGGQDQERQAGRLHQRAGQSGRILSVLREEGKKYLDPSAGMELSKNVAIEFKPCATDAKSFNYSLTKPITPELYEFFKPFCILNFDMGKARLGEIYILDSKTKQPIMKLQGRIGSIRIKNHHFEHTGLQQEQRRSKLSLSLSAKLQKYQLCAGCHACENACKHSAIRLIKNGPADTDYRYEIDETKCIHCFECINHYQGGCYMRRVLLPRGKGYSAK